MARYGLRFMYNIFWQYQKANVSQLVFLPETTYSRYTLPWKIRVLPVCQRRSISVAVKFLKQLLSIKHFYLFWSFEGLLNCLLNLHCFVSCKILDGPPSNRNYYCSKSHHKKCCCLRNRLSSVVFVKWSQAAEAIEH